MFCDQPCFREAPGRTRHRVPPPPPRGAILGGLLGPIILDGIISALEKGSQMEGVKRSGPGPPEGFRSRGVSKKLLPGTWPGLPAEPPQDSLYEAG